MYNQGQLVILTMFENHKIPDFITTGNVTHQVKQKKTPFTDKDDQIYSITVRKN